MLNSNSTPLRAGVDKDKPKERKGSRHAGNSLSKYNYSNYKYLNSSEKSNKSNRSHDRLHYSDKKFNWMKNEKIQ